MKTKLQRNSILFVTAALIFAPQGFAQRTNNDRRLISNPNVIIEGGTNIEGCDVGIRKVDGVLYCPPSSAGPGRTPAGYFWDVGASNELAASLGQVWRTDRTGAFIRIVATGQSCSGNNMLVTYNNGDVVDQGFNASCVFSPPPGPEGGGGREGGGQVGGGGQGGYLGVDGALHATQDENSVTVGGKQLGVTNQQSAAVGFATNGVANGQSSNNDAGTSVGPQ